MERLAVLQSTAQHAQNTLWVGPPGCVAQIANMHAPIKVNVPSIA